MPLFIPGPTNIGSFLKMNNIALLKENALNLLSLIINNVKENIFLVILLLLVIDLKRACEIFDLIEKPTLKSHIGLYKTIELLIKINKNENTLTITKD